MTEVQHLLAKPRADRAAWWLFGLMLLASEAAWASHGVTSTSVVLPKSDELPGRLFVNAGLRTADDSSRFVQYAIAVDPNTGIWTRLQNLSPGGGFSVPLGPVRVARDGRTMLFMKGAEIWKCDATNGENPVLVLAKGRPAAWSPDNKEFVAVVTTGEPDKTENWRVSAEGEKRSVIPVPIGEVVEDWSPDGQWFVGWSHADGELYVMKLDGAGRRQLTHTEGNAKHNQHARFSPDSKRIVYHRALYAGENEAGTTHYSLRAVSIDGTDDREILGEVSSGATPDAASWTAPMGARWSPDGKYLAIVLFDHNGRGVLAINGNWRIAIAHADGSALRILPLDGVLNAVLPWDGPEWR